MLINSKKKYYEQLEVGDYDVQVIVQSNITSVPAVGEIIYYNNCDTPFRICKSWELWCLQDLCDEHFLSRAVMNSQARLAMSATMNKDTSERTRLYALVLAPEEEQLITLRNQENVVIGWYSNHQLGKHPCINFPMIGCLSSMMKAYHPEMAAEDVGYLTAGIFNGKYYAILSSIQTQYANNHLTGYVIFDEEGNVLSEAQADRLANKPIPSVVLDECRLICDRDGNFKEAFKRGVRRHLRGCVWQLTGVCPDGVIEIE